MRVGVLGFRAGLRIRKQKSNLEISYNQAIMTLDVDLMLGNLEVWNSASYGGPYYYYYY